MPRTNVPLDDIVVRKQLPLGQNKHQHQMKFSEIDYLFEGVGYRVYLIYAFRSNFLNEMECKEFHRERGLFILPWVVPESISPTKGICTPCRAYEINYSWPFCWSVGYRMAWESDSAFFALRNGLVSKEAAYSLQSTWRIQTRYQNQISLRCCLILEFVRERLWDTKFRLSFLMPQPDILCNQYFSSTIISQLSITSTCYRWTICGLLTISEHNMPLRLQMLIKCIY